MQVSSIAIRTGTVQNAESDCRAVMEICDKDGHCCQTTPNGKGLDHPGKDRRSGQTDIYTSTAVLGNCAEVIREACRIFFGFDWEFLCECSLVRGPTCQGVPALVFTFHLGILQASLNTY